jgi:predicted membrane channel-forming protein YqfA (hemolysin III family)
MYHGERFNGYTHLAGALLAAAGATTLSQSKLVLELSVPVY